MDRISRILVVIISVGMILSFFFPIWTIQLEAPQYPEGLGMQIWISKLSGDISTINGLNHYIGMKVIDENSIPELRYMPYLLAAIITAGLLTSIIGNKWMLYGWVFLFAALGVAGGMDFYLWEYDYGHNLDPRAAIKIPGMYYQPPLLGSKQLLNFVANSYPAVGGLIIIISGIVAILIMIYTLFKSKNLEMQNLNISIKNKTSFAHFFIIGLSAILFFSSCTNGPQPINYGADQCDHCKMKIVDERFGGELVTNKGKMFKFDGIECMVQYYNNTQEEKRKEIEFFMVADAINQGKLINANSAVYLESVNLPSPMGGNISAYSKVEDIKKMQEEFPGVVLNWEQVQSKF